MSRLPVFTFVALICAVPVTASAAETLHWVERATNEHVVDLAPKGDSLGDLLVFVNPLYDAANKTLVGASNGYCVRTEVGKTWACSWTMKVEGGELTVTGTYPDQGDSEFAITGGTGRRSGAHGTLKVHAKDATHTTYDFTAILL